MLFKLSLKNLKKSIKDYAIYFFTLILGVSIFYIFNSMETQTVFLNVTSSTREIIQMMITMLSGVSVFVSFILGFLIIYANQFLMKRRKKEFAKRRITRSRFHHPPRANARGGFFCPLFLKAPSFPRCSGFS